MDHSVKKDLKTLLPRTGGDACCLYLRSGHGNIFELISGVGVTQRLMELCQYVRIGHGFIGKTAESGQIRVSEAIEEDMTYSRGASAAEGYKSAIGIPIIDQEEVVGVLYLLWRQRETFSISYIQKIKKITAELREEVALLHMLAETRRRARALEILYRLGGEIYGLMDLKRIGEIVSEEIKAFLDLRTFLICMQGDYREQCVICEGDWVGQEKLILAQSEGQSDLHHSETLEASAESRQIMSLHPDKKAPISKSSKFITIPITLGNQNLGRIVIGFRKRLGLESWEIDFLQQVCRQIGIAVSNYDMFISHQIRTTFLERNRLSGEFHDSLAQILASIILEVNVAKEVANREKSDLVGKKLDTINDMLNGAYEEVRVIIQDLGIYPLRNTYEGQEETTDKHDFFELLKVYLANFESRTSLEVRRKLPRTKIEVPLDIEVQLWRIVQESLNNIWKHACATKVDIRMSLEKDNLKVAIADNGCGITPQVSTLVNDGKHFGLKVMHDRAKSVGGELTIDTAPGAGTCVKASFPLVRYSGLSK